MAKKKNIEEESDVKQEKEESSAKLSKLLIKDFNNSSKTGKIAWCLATDLDNPTEVTEYISTGSDLLNYIISNKKDGGIPVGKLTEIIGEEASGKSLLCAHLIAECQKRKGLAVYMDVENAASPGFMEQLGVDISELVYLQPGTVEEVGDAIEKTIMNIRNKAPNKLVLIIWDSVAGTPTKCEIEGTYELNMNTQLEKSKVLAKMMRKLTEVWGKERIAMVFTNQLKTKIGVMYGDPMTTPGGKAIAYHSSVRLRMNRGANESDEKTKQVWGVHTTCKTVKNRLGPPLRKCEFDITFASGIDNVGSLFGCLHAAGEIEKANGWCIYSTVPSGKETTKLVDGKKVTKDYGLQFRESEWTKTYESNAALRKQVELDLEKHLVVKYGKKVIDRDVDPDSIMDIEALNEAGLLSAEIENHG